MTGKKIYDLAAEHLGETYILGSIAPKNNSNYRGPWDCAEFFAWLVYQVSGKLYGCANNNGNPASADAYTGFLKRDVDKLGKIISVDQAAKTKGAAILRYSGSGMIGHVVISDGSGGTIEAHSHKDGVIRSVVSGRRWDIGILVPWIDYEQTAATIKVEKPDIVIYRFKDPMMHGDKVAEIQSALDRYGDHLTVDGYYGSHTFYAVKQFQAQHNLVSDGEVGPNTAHALGIKL